jgi:putative Holliday junction resolvase
VIGVPYTENEEHPLRQHIEKFQTTLNNLLDSENISLPIHYQDESFTSIDAVNVMIEIGKKKKQRAKKGNKDGVAAALILRDFMETIE